jgi:6-phosphofructokinase 1
MWQPLKIEFERRGLNTSITANPKTVDNDIGIIDSSFGFQTAVEIAQQAIDAAHVEAVSDVGLVKLMGWSTGHIHLEGKGGLFEFLYKKGHADIVVAAGPLEDVAGCE